MIRLVTITLPDGRAIRAASEACEVAVRSLPAQGPLQYAGILVGDVDLVEEADPFSLDGVAALTQATIEITTDLDLAAMAGDWHQLTAARGEVAILEAGDDWEDRRVLLADAPVQQLEIGRVGEPTRLVLESAPDASGGLVGDPDRDLATDYGANNDTGGNPFSDLDGYRPLVVIGRCYGVPAFKVDSGGGFNQLCLAGHPFADVGGVTVYEEGVSAGTFNPSNTTAPLSGEDVCEVSAAAAFLATDGAYTYDASRGGIAAYDDASQPALNADGVVSKLLALSGVRVDWAGSLEALRLIAGYDVGVWLDEPADALEVLRSRLLPILPIYEVQGPAGLRLVSGRVAGRRPEFSAVVGQELVGALGGITFSDLDEVYNDFSIRYAYDSFRGDYQTTAHLGADESALCYFSQQLRQRAGQPGVRSMVIESDCVWNGRTAWRILRDFALRYALPRRQVSYLADGTFARRLHAGMVGLLTDSERGITSVPCVVRRLQLAEPAVVDLVLDDRTPVEDPT